MHAHPRTSIRPQAEVWSDTYVEYSPLWLRPTANLVADELAGLAGDAAAATSPAMVPAAALARLGRALKREGPADPGYTAQVAANPNWPSFFPAGWKPHMPAWAFDAPGYAAATAAAAAREASPGAWNVTFSFGPQDLVRPAE